MLTPSEIRDLATRLGEALEKTGKPALLCDMLGVMQRDLRTHLDSQSVHAVVQRELHAELLTLVEQAMTAVEAEQRGAGPGGAPQYSEHIHVAVALIEDLVKKHFLI